MGQTLSEPVTEKESAHCQNDQLTVRKKLYIDNENQYSLLCFFSRRLLFDWLIFSLAVS